MTIRAPARGSGPAAAVISYELREDCAAAGRRNVAGVFRRWHQPGRLRSGGNLRRLHGDRRRPLFLDLAERASPCGVAASCAPRGRQCCLYVRPQSTGRQGCRALERDGVRREVHRFETLVRQLAVKGYEICARCIGVRAIGLHHRRAPPGLALAGMARTRCGRRSIAGTAREPLASHESDSTTTPAIPDAGTFSAERERTSPSIAAPT